MCVPGDFRCLTGSRPPPSRRRLSAARRGLSLSNVNSLDGQFKAHVITPFRTPAPRRCRSSGRHPVLDCHRSDPDCRGAVCWLGVLLTNQGDSGRRACLGRSPPTPCSRCRPLSHLSRASASSIASTHVAAAGSGTRLMNESRAQARECRDVVRRRQCQWHHPFAILHMTRWANGPRRSATT